MYVTSGRWPVIRRRAALVVLLAGAALLASSCLEWLRWTFDVEEPFGERTIQGDYTGGLLSETQTILLDVQHEQAFQEQDFEKVYSVVVTELSFWITANSESPSLDVIEDGDPDDFSFIKSVSIHVKAVIDGVDKKELVAHLEEGDAQLAPGGRVLDFNVTGTNVSRFILAEGGYSISIEATGSVPPDDVIFAGMLKYDVTVGIRE